MKDLKSINNSPSSEWEELVPLLGSSGSVQSFSNSFKQDGAGILNASSTHTAEERR